MSGSNSYPFFSAVTPASYPAAQSLRSSTLIAEGPGALPRLMRPRAFQIASSSGISSGIEKPAPTCPRSGSPVLGTMRYNSEYSVSRSSSSHRARGRLTPVRLLYQEANNWNDCLGSLWIVNSASCNRVSIRSLQSCW